MSQQQEKAKLGDQPGTSASFDPEAQNVSPSPTSSQYTWTTCTSWYLDDLRDAASTGASDLSQALSSSQTTTAFPSYSQNSNDQPTEEETTNAPPSPTSSQYTWTTCTSWYLEDVHNIASSTASSRSPAIPYRPTGASLPPSSQNVDDEPNEEEKHEKISKQMVRRAICDSSDSGDYDSDE